MARYLIELYNRYKLPVIQVVLYIGEDNLKMQSEINFEILDTRIEYKYKIIDVKTIKCEKFLNSNKSDLLILAILCDFKDRDKSKVVREILQKIEKLNLKDELEKKNYILKLEVLSKLRNLEEIVVKEERMLDSIRVEDTLNYKNGKLVGIEKGIEKEKIYIALKMLKSGIKIEDIANFTELSIEKIKVLQLKKN